MTVSSKCKYSSKFLPLVKIWAEEIEDSTAILDKVGAFKELLSKCFNDDTEVLYNELSGKLSDMFPKAYRFFNSTPVPIQGRQGQTPTDTPPIVNSSWFNNDRTGRFRMERNFKKNMVTRLIVDINFENGDFKFLETTPDAINKAIYKYKMELVNEIYNAIDGTKPIEIKENISEEEFTKIVVDAINKAEQNADLIIKNASAKEAICILENFDTFLKSNLNFVKRANITRKGIYESLNKYVYTGPTVTHYSNWSSKETVGIDDQISQLASIILDVLPDVDEFNGKEIISQDKVVGMDGFKCAMTDLKRALLYSPFMNSSFMEYRKGIDAMDMQSIINNYIKNTSTIKPGQKESMSEFHRGHQTFLQGKLRSISKYLMGANTDPFVRAMFIQMFAKMDSIAYRAYQKDFISNEFQGTELNGKFLNLQRRQLERAFQSQMHFMVKNSTSSNEFLSKWGITINDGVITIKSISDADATLEMTSGHNDKGFYCDITSNTLTDNDLNALIKDALGITMPDSYTTCSGKYDENWFENFAHFVGMSILKADGIMSNSAENLENFKTTTLTLALTNISEIFSIINGGDLKSVVKSPSGSGLPTQQLTSLGYKTRMIIQDCQEDFGRRKKTAEIRKEENDYSNNIQTNGGNILVSSVNLLGMPHIRNEVFINGQAKASTELVMSELIHLSMFEDFFYAYKKGGAIYLQNATFSDKSTHFLQEYRLDGTLVLPDEMAEKMGHSKDITLKELIDISLKDGGKLVSELTRSTREKRYRTLENNIGRSFELAYFTDENKNIVAEAPFKVNGNNYDIVALHNWIVENKYSLSDIKTKFAEKGIRFDEEIFASKTGINDVLMNAIVTSKDPILWEKRMEIAKYKFLKSIEKENIVIDTRVDRTIDETVTNLDNDFYDAKYKQLRLVKGKKLHPIVEAFFAIDVLLSNDFNSLHIGEVYAHASKAKGFRQNNDPSYIKAKMEDSPIDVLAVSNNTTFSNKKSVNVSHKQFENKFKTIDEHINAILHPENIKDPEIKAHYENIKAIFSNPENRHKTIFHTTDDYRYALLAQYLINYHNWDENIPYSDEQMEFSEATRLVAQIKRSVIYGATMHSFAQGLQNGVADYMDIAVIDDMKGFTANPNGDDESSDGSQDTMDGSGGECSIASRLENNSLLDARVGANKKSIVHYIDPMTGKPVLLKWAVYEYTNEVRRMSVGSNAKAETLTRKMYQKKNISERILGNRLDINEKLQNVVKQGLLYEDWRTGEHYRITYANIDENGNIIVKGDIVDKNGRAKQSNITLNSRKVNYLYDLDQALGGAWTGSFNENGEWTFNEKNVDILTDFVTTYGWKDAFTSYIVNKSAIKVGASNVNINTTWQDENPLKTFKIATAYGGVQGDYDHELAEAEVTEMTQMISALIEDGNYTSEVNQIYRSIGEIVTAKLQEDGFLDAVTKGDTEQLYRIIGESLYKSTINNTRDTIGLAQAFIKRAKSQIDAYNNRQTKDRLIPNLPASAATVSGLLISDLVSSLNRGAIRHKYDGFAGVLNPSYNMIQYFRVDGEARLFRQFMDGVRSKFTPEQIQDPNFLNVIQTQLIINGTINPFCKEVTENTEAIDFEDTVIITDKDGNQLHRVYVDRFGQYDWVKNVIGKNPEYRFFINEACPRNLKQNDTRFVINGREYGLMDLDSVRATYYLMNPDLLAANPNGNDIIQKVLARNGNPIKLEDQIAACRAETKAILQTLDSASKESGNVAQLITSSAFDNGDAFVQVYGAYVRPQECIMGRYQGEKFGIGKNDHIHAILKEGPMYFERMLENRYDKDIFKMASTAEMNMFDSILYASSTNEESVVNIEPVLHSLTTIDAFEQLSNDELKNKNARLQDSKSYVLENNKWYHRKVDGELEFICNATDKDGNIINVIKDYDFGYNALDTESGETVWISDVKPIIFSFTEDAYNKTEKSSYFDNIVYHNYNESNVDKEFETRLDRKKRFATYRDKNGKINKFDATNFYNDPEKQAAFLELLKQEEEFNKNSHFARIAKNQFEAFKKQLNYIGSRIPTQAMQSFTPMQVIAFCDVDTNVLYVARQQTKIQGSDYDIDKLYCLAYSIRYDGTLSAGTLAEKDLGFNIASNLVTPKGRTFELTEDPNVGAYNVDLTFLSKLDSVVNGISELTPEIEKAITNELNNILSSNLIAIKIAFNGELTPEIEKLGTQLIKILNEHEATDVKIITSKEALRNKTVERINSVVKGIKNQLSAQVAIDECTKIPKKAAKESPMGQAENHLTSDNPLAKFEMQVQNMIGKAVVGTGAVSLKAYFAICTTYNIAIDEICEKIKAKHTIDQEVINLLNNIYFISPWDNSIVSVTGLNWNKLIGTINAEGLGDMLYKYYAIENKSYVAKTAPISEFLTMVKNNTIRTDSALDLSAIISMAADNAKDLALAKLNATQSLVDIYTYCSMIGVPFTEISDIMSKSDIFSYTVAISTKNIFDISTEKLDTKRAIDFILGDDVLPGVDRDVWAWAWNEVANKPYREAISKVKACEEKLKNAKPEDVEKYTKELNEAEKARKAAEKKWNEAQSLNIKKPNSKDENYNASLRSWDVLAIKRRNAAIELINNTIDLGAHKPRVNYEEFEDDPEAMLQGANDYFDDDYNDDQFAGRTAKYVSSLDSDCSRDIKLSDLVKVRYCLEKANDKLTKGFTKEDYAALRKIKKVLNGVEEMSTIGGILGINQGIKTNTLDLYNFINRVDSFINKKLTTEVKKSLGLSSDATFSLVEFMQASPDMQQLWISIYEDVHKTSFNLLKVITQVPHFNKMLFGMSTVVSALKSSCARFNAEFAIMDSICKSKNDGGLGIFSLKPDEFKELDKYINDLLVNNFLNTNPITIKLPSNSWVYNNMIAPDEIHYGGYELKIQDPMSAASFKCSMDRTIIPMLKKLYPNNSFIQALIPYYYEEKGRMVSGYHLPLQMMDIDSNILTQSEYSDYLEAFNEIAKNPIKELGGIKIADLFFLYNLIVNKDGYGQMSLTRIFEEIVSDDHMPELINAYYNSISQLDFKGRDRNPIIGMFDADEFTWKVNNNIPNSKFPTSNLTGPSKTQSDLTLILPNKYKYLQTGEKVKEGSDEKLNAAQPFNAKLSSTEIIRALANEIGRQYNGNIMLITDDEIIENGWIDAENQNAFIRDGVIYFNISPNRISLESGIHELSHIFLAAMKQSSPEKYFAIMEEIKKEQSNESGVYATYSQLPQYQNLAGSDLDEEMFCKYLEMYLAGFKNANSNVVAKLSEGNSPLKALSTALGLETPIDPTACGRSLDIVCRNFLSELFGSSSLNVNIETTKRHQKIIALKTKLFNSKEDNNKLELNCNE